MHFQPFLAVFPHPTLSGPSWPVTPRQAVLWSSVEWWSALAPLVPAGCG